MQLKAVQQSQQQRLSEAVQWVGRRVGYSTPASFRPAAMMNYHIIPRIRALTPSVVLPGNDTDGGRDQNRGGRNARIVRALPTRAKAHHRRWT